MVGQTVSHYRIVEKLGGGGMGVVYKALDLRLNRFVALKFLSAELTRDREANARFRQEAQAASALDHPNICTIHEIDQTADGRLFLALAFCSGDTLKTRIARGPMPVDSALDIAIQIANGLGRAHQSRIVHRDIKPANVMVSEDGLVKIVDFGLAKLTGDADLTRTGTTLGTVAYMSPEQARGDLVGLQTDVWALGVVLYEMLAGARPFTGPDNVAVLTKILAASPTPLGDVRRDAPALLQRIVARALSPAPADRYPSALDMLADLTECQQALEAERARSAGVWQTMRRPLVAVPMAAIILLAAAGGGVAWWKARRVQWARNEAIPEIQRLADRDDFAAGFALAEQVDAIVPNDPALAALWPLVSASGDFAETIEGAQVFVQPYDAPNQNWQRLGSTPLKDVKLVRNAYYRVRVEKAGYVPRLLAARMPGNLILPPAANNANAMRIEMTLESAGTADLIPISGGTFAIALNGFIGEDRYDLGPFSIDRYEVTNADFKRFVDSGGYAEYSLSRFVDTTGKPAPAGWELGRYPVGQERYPVTGVSWFEADAYCRAAGKALPTLYHWGRAALSPIEQGSALAPAIVPASNFSGKGLAAVGTYRGLGPFGTDDMAGNAREWVFNELPDGTRWTAGGAWNDPEYMFAVPYSLPPSDRSATNGFRCAKYPTEPAASLLGPVGRAQRDFRTAKPVSDEVYRVFARQYAYVPSPLNVRVESRDDTNADWVREVVTFDAGYEPGRMTMYVFLPKHAVPPYQAVIQFPGADAFLTRGSSATLQPNIVNNYIARSGRALVLPVFKGAYERWDPFLSLGGEGYLSAFRTHTGQWRQDLGRVIDVLGARPAKDIDVSRIAYFGVSFGGSMPLPLLALENRLKVAVLSSAGFTFRPVPPESDGVNYAAHITMPVLLLGGKHDFLFPLETSQKPFFARLGTPAKDKLHVIFDAGHQGFPRSENVREVLGWLDRYLGPVNVK